MPPHAGPRRYTRPIELGALEVARRKAASQLSVFLAGPFIERTWSAEEVSAASSGARLRFALMHAIERLQHELILGEHTGVAEITGDHIPTVANVAASELQLVENCDAVIIIPDSPGSFCELGSWIMREDFCAKTLVLGNSKFQHVFSYVANGAFSMAKDANARIEWIDYDDHSGVSALVQEYLSVRQDRLILRRLRRGG